LHDPAKGSPHNRGLSVDVSLFSLTTGELEDLGSGFDEPSIRALSAFAGGSERSRYLRRLLATIMDGVGFSGISHEWWHFDYQDFADYKLLNISLTEITGGK
jgi:D-alanyl-D-alanine dipeptidase